MKTKFLMLGIVALLVCCFTACNKDEPTYDGSGTGGTVKFPSASFSLEIKQPLSVVIKDNSIADYVRYNMGNGKTYTASPGEEFTYRYEKAGTYTITCSAHNRYAEVSERTVTIKIITPSVYFKGLVYLKVDNDEKYYKFKFNDDGPWIIKTWVESYYTELLYNKNLPASYILKDPVLLENPTKYTYYTLYVYWNTKQSGSGTQCLKQNVKVSDIMKYPEYIEVFNDSKRTQVRILFEYK